MSYVRRDTRMSEIEYNERPTQRIVRALRHFDSVTIKDLWIAMGVPQVVCLESDCYTQALCRLVKQGIVEKTKYKIGLGTAAYNESHVRLTGKKITSFSTWIRRQRTQARAARLGKAA